MERETVVTVVTAPEPGSVAVEAPENSKGVGEKLECEDEKVEKYSCVIDVKCENDKLQEEEEMICRICHLSSDQAESPTNLILLGCGCKGELGVAHVQCGQAWFKLKGNRKCEICGEVATNIIGVEENWNSFVNAMCKIVMATVVVTFVLPWIFRVNIGDR